MFQSFEDTSDPSRGAERIARLRAEMVECELDGYIVPRADEHQGEYVAAYAERLYWLTGFNGSAGVAIVLADDAAIFVDGRYTLQVREQVDTDAIQARHVTDDPPDEWLASRLVKGARIGFDPWLHTRDQVRRFDAVCRRTGAEMVPTESNLVDTIWHDQPPPPAGPVVVHPLQFSGEPAQEKIDGIRQELSGSGEDAVVLTLPDSIAWLFNIRGNDVPHVPVPLAFAIVPADGKPMLYLDPAKLGQNAQMELERVAELREPNSLESDLRTICEGGRSIRVDPASAPYQVVRVLQQAEANLSLRTDPCILRKARKNAFEIAGSHTAHKRDGLAVCRFLAWLDHEAPKGRIDEIAAAKELELFRAETGKLKDISFDSISATGANAAIVHYRVTYASARKLQPGSLYLIDSGAQYQDGTTDITRTVAIGEPSAEMRERFTRVLKGHIAIATARFPVGTSGGQLDILARLPLWEIGADYDHGTGHGVGSYLSVHEGPQRISKSGSHVALEPGMILSNEPGYYKEGAYGIRIENLVLVRGADDDSGTDKTVAAPDEGRPMLHFETLTLAPIDARLVDASLLTAAELAWLNDYHAHVFETIGPRLKESDRAWLASATKPIKSR